MVFQFKDMMIKEPETELDRFWLSRASTKVIFQFVRLRGFKILKERIQGTGSGPSFRILVRPSPPSSPQGSARAARAAKSPRPACSGSRVSASRVCVSRVSESRVSGLRVSGVRCFGRPAG